MPELREVVWQGRTFMVDEHGVVQHDVVQHDVVQHDVDMVEYDRLLEEAGFEFIDDPPEDEEPVTELTFLASR